MLSRVAHALYWMARHVERAENMARCIEVTLNVTLDRKYESAGQWQPLIMTTGDQESYVKKHADFSQDKVIDFLAFDRDYSSSIISCLTMARENARTLREVISSEMWEHLNELYMRVKEKKYDQDDPFVFFQSIKLGAITFGGLSTTTMSRGEGWQWMLLGMMLERADKTSRILDVKYYTLLPKASDVGTNYDHVQWRSLLQCASALRMYRQQHRQMTPASIAQFLLFDNKFPRSLVYCLNSADAALHMITGSPPGRFANKAEKALGRAQSELRYAEIDEIIESGIHEFIDKEQQELNLIDSLLYKQYFSLPVSSN